MFPAASQFTCFGFAMQINQARITLVLWAHTLNFDASMTPSRKPFQTFRIKNKIQMEKFHVLVGVITNLIAVCLLLGYVQSELARLQSRGCWLMLLNFQKCHKKKKNLQFSILFTTIRKLTQTHG